MAKLPGLTINDFKLQGRVIGNPEISDGWAKMNILTVEGERQPDGSYIDVEHTVPVLCNIPKIITTIESFVQDERQLLLNCRVTSWKDETGNVQTGVMIKTLQLGGKTMYDPDAQNNNSGGNQYPS